MTSAEMLEAVRVGADLKSNAPIPGFEDTEIYNFLNEAQDSVLLKYLTQADYNILSDLLIRKSLTVAQHTLYNVTGDRRIWKKLYSCNIDDTTLGETFIQFVRAETETTRSDFASQGSHAATWLDCIFIEKESSSSVIPTPYNDPYIELPYCWITENSTGKRSLTILVDHDTTITTSAGKAFLYYIKYPDSIASGDNPSALNKAVHREIVDKAIAIITGTSNPQLEAQKLQNSAMIKNI